MQICIICKICGVGAIYLWFLFLNFSIGIYANMHDVHNMWGGPTQRFGLSMLAIWFLLISICIDAQYAKYAIYMGGGGWGFVFQHKHMQICIIC